MIIIFSNPYVAFGHRLHGLTEKVSGNAKKLTCVRRFWHGLHGLKITVQKISPEWLFTSSKEYFFSHIHMWHFDTDFTDLQIKFQRVLKN